MLTYDYLVFKRLVCLLVIAILLPIHISSSQPMLKSINKHGLILYQITSVIHQFKCHCEADYIGRTSQLLENRISHHVLACIRNRRQRNRSLSASRNVLRYPVSEISGHNKDIFWVLCKLHWNFYLKVMEFIFIKF